MSKEYLEAFEILLQHIETEADWSDYEKVKNAHKIVEQALQRLEAIDNANPSEALECLDGIEYVADVLKVNHKIGSRDIANQEIKEMAERLYYRIPTIKQALLKAQEQEKVLEIIKEKDVDIYILRKCKTVDEYNSKIVHIVGETRELTQKEFDLLKGVLE